MHTPKIACIVTILTLSLVIIPSSVSAQLSDPIQSPTPDLQKSKPIAKISADDSIGLNPLAEIRTYNNSISFPNKIQVNEPFTINYEWTSTGLGLTKSFALYPDKYMPKGSNVTIIFPPWVEFVDNVNYEKSNECSNFIYAKFDLNTINTSTQFGNFSVKYTKQPADSYVVADITFGDGGSIAVVESQNPQLRNNTNGTIHLYQSSYDEDPDRRYDYSQNVKCVRIEKPVTSNIYAQSTSDATLSPKKQMDAGIEPYNVVCKEEFLLVERNQNKIACVSEKIAQKLGWKILQKIQTDKAIPTKPVNAQPNVPDEKITITSEPRIRGHGTMYSILEPITTFKIPRNIAIGENFSINYNISWVDENGTSLYPTPYANGSAISFIPRLSFPDEFLVLNDSFKADFALAYRNSPHMIVQYAGKPIFFNNDTTHGSIELQLTKKMSHELDDFILAFNNPVDFQIHSDNSSITLKPKPQSQPQPPMNTPPTFRVNSSDSYTIFLTFHNDTQKWQLGPYEIDTLPNGLPNYTSRDDVVMQNAHNISENTVVSAYVALNEPDYILKKHWKSFAEFLRNVEQNEGIQITKAWLMNENLSEEFVDDFFQEYPEFLIHETLSHDFFTCNNF